MSLKKLDYLARNQLQRIHSLSGDRNARRILDNLKPYVSTFRGENGENIYYLSKSGRERVGCDVVRNKTNQAGHYLMRNDAFIYYAGNEDWKNEVKFTVEGVLTLIPDAYFRHNQRRHFLEVDHLQHQHKNREKIDKYRKLSETGVFQQKLKYFPRLVWVTLTESRKRQLLEWCAGLDVVVHVWKDIN
ncbi:replication-relaxation family protein [Paenibacillus sp. LPE1-1-1.1]|uniref:replication-relaxation family protein n=1 Tax=Paenibacillus sp. LPE1-1-1.1 TaxID=3135230 RepID=UPI003436E2DD